jgi:hypothetical protein
MRESRQNRQRVRFTVCCNRGLAERGGARVPPAAPCLRERRRPAGRTVLAEYRTELTSSFAIISSISQKKLDRREPSRVLIGGEGTIKTHLTHVFGNVGVGARTQLIARIA